ncbi:MAG: PEP-CTERM sorting domain-containing protein [Akkermansiaceae bacterium]
MNNTSKLAIGVAISSLSLSSMSSAANFAMTGGNIRLAANWQNTGDLTTGNLPTVGDTATIAVAGTMNNQFGGILSGVAITQTAGAMTASGFNWSSSLASSSYSLEGGTITATGNYNIQNTTFNLSGGTFSFNAQLLSNSADGTFNVSGNAIISAVNDFDLRINQDGGTFDIASDWTGSFISADDDTEADWIAQLVYGAGMENAGIAANENAARRISVGGTDITDANFGNFFVVTANNGGGSTLALVPEPSSTALLGLGGLALLFRRRK